MTLDTVVVVNPASAGGRTARHWPAIRAALERAGVAFDHRLTTGPGDATAIAAEALRRGAERIVAVGGDGTLNEVVNGCFAADGVPLRPSATVALVPSGTGGDFRRTLGIPTAFDACAALLAADHRRPLDVGRIDYDGGESRRRYFVNIADCGIGGEVVARVNRSGKQGSGKLTFLYHSLVALLTFPGTRLRVKVDDRVRHGRFGNVVVANGRYFGGSMLVAPQADCGDGLFDVVLFAHRPRVRALTEIRRLYDGSHLGRPGVELLRGERVVITPLDVVRPAQFDVDGEQVGQAPAELVCLRHALRVCVPAP